MFDIDKIYNDRPPNLVPKCDYLLPASDREQPDDVQEWLRCHPVSYGFRNGKEMYARCPTCEEWTGSEGCTVRKMVNEGDLEGAKAQHLKVEWPAGSGQKAYKNMKPDYRLVTFKYV